MTPAAPLFRSSGDLIADRRYAFARDFAARGDIAAAADLYAQAVEVAPGFVSAWFGLGEARARLGQTAEAIAAFQKAVALDPQDAHGAGLHLVRLGAAPPGAMPADYVRTLFDQYAPRFDTALTEGLSYRAPDLLLTAVGTKRFTSALDLGCGTGLGGAAFRPHVDRLTGVDLSANMVAQAEAKGLYDRLVVADLVAFLAAEAAASYDLVFAADVFAYFPDLRPLCGACARVLGPGGTFAFTVETHAGDGATLGPSLRYSHGAAHVREALSGFRLLALEPASSRTEAGAPVPGLVAVAERR